MAPGRHRGLGMLSSWGQGGKRRDSCRAKQLLCPEKAAGQLTEVTQGFSGPQGGPPLNAGV